jgi:hypothetical protein
MAERNARYPKPYMDPVPDNAIHSPVIDRPDLPIAEAAWDVMEIEPEAPIAGDFEISLGDSFDPDLRALFDRRQRTEVLHAYRLRDVTLDASTMLLLKGRSRIAETRYLIDDGAYADVLVKPLYPEPADPTKYYVIGCNRAWYNYYHWLVQTIPAIDASVRRNGLNRLALILPPLRPWQEESLALLGYQEIPRLTFDISTHYQLANAEFSEFLGARMGGVVSLTAAATFRRLAEAVPWKPGAAEEIYVARTDAQNRVARNEGELIERLDRQGVRIIVPGSMSLSEQIAAFRSARLVIGPHGAGLSNIAFCQPGSFVYEMLLRDYPNFCFNRIAQSAGLNYAADLFEGDGHPDAHQQTWHIDLDLVSVRLDAIRARIAATPRVESAMNFLKRTQTAPPDHMALPVEAPAVVERAPPRPHGLLARASRAIARLFSRGGGQQ